MILSINSQQSIKIVYFWPHSFSMCVPIWLLGVKLLFIGFDGLLSCTNFVRTGYSLLNELLTGIEQTCPLLRLNSERGHACFYVPQYFFTRTIWLFINVSLIIIIIKKTQPSSSYDKHKTNTLHTEHGTNHNSMTDRRETFILNKRAEIRPSFKPTPVDDQQTNVGKYDIFEDQCIAFLQHRPYS